MSQQQNKQTIEFRPSKFRSNTNLRRLSMKQVQFPEVKKRVMSGILGLSQSRVFFHKRGDRLKVPKYQNTYRLEPFRYFDVEVVDKMVKDLMESKLSYVTSYHPNQMAKLSFEIGSELQKALCKKDYDRYKLVVQVSIIQRLDQSIHAGFQCLWDADRDNYSYYVFENNHIYAWCCVFATYYDQAVTMSTYSNYEYVDMIKALGVCHGNTTAAAEYYRQQFPNRQ